MNKKNIIFLRGLTRSTIHWGEFPEVFKKCHPDSEVEFLEIPGNGTLCRAKTPTDPLAAIKQIQDVSHFVKKGETFHLCGISLGGMLALKWAELFPEQVESVTTINCSLSQFSPFYQRLSPKLYFIIAKGLFFNGPECNELMILKVTSNKKESVDRYFYQFAEFAKAYPTKKKNFFRQLHLANNIKLSKLNMPIKVICSDGDRLCSSECSKIIAKALKAELVIHPKAGHDLPLDEPEWLAGQIDWF